MSSRGTGGGSMRFREGHPSSAKRFSWPRWRRQVQSDIWREVHEATVAGAAMLKMDLGASILSAGAGLLVLRLWVAATLAADCRWAGVRPADSRFRGRDAGGRSPTSVRRSRRRRTDRCQRPVEPSICSRTMSACRAVSSIMCTSAHRIVGDEPWTGEAAAGWLRSVQAEIRSLACRTSTDRRSARCSPCHRRPA